MTEPLTNPLTIDEHRYSTRITGILVRAYRAHTGTWVNADIADLDTDSLNAWLRSRGGANDLAENVVRHLLGHP